jgi:hypothetical protein
MIVWGIQKHLYRFPCFFICFGSLLAQKVCPAVNVAVFTTVIMQYPFNYRLGFLGSGCIIKVNEGRLFTSWCNAGNSLRSCSMLKGIYYG